MCREDRIRKLKGIIEEAFADIPYPGDHNITKEHHCDECYEIAEALRGKHWRDITPEFLSRHPGLLNAFQLLYPAAARYFLPAYLLALIECRDADSLEVFPEYVLYALANDSPKYELRFLERFDPLSKDQKRAVRLSLEHLVEADDDIVRESAEDALETYWRDK